MYSIKEIFYTLQGEGANTGRPAVFCRFTGCNLWSGREEDRDKAICNFCDTDFVGTDGVGGGKFKTPEDVAEAMLAVRRSDSDWADYDVHADKLLTTPSGQRVPILAVLTGGEPMLQVNLPLIRCLHNAGFEIAVETNGTLPVPGAIDWICVSPKSSAPLSQIHGDELKLVYPQVEISPEDVVKLDFKHRYLQPMDGPDIAKNTAATIAYCKTHPQWRLSLQTHKTLGIR
ncbi:MAG: 7-carboxy-7-deazaguanine synthase [Hyphomicrobiaceae bacterium]